MNVGTAGKAILIVSTALDLLVVVGCVLLWHRFVFSLWLSSRMVRLLVVVVV